MKAKFDRIMANFVEDGKCINGSKYGSNKDSV
jgi:hypothetical protein